MQVEKCHGCDLKFDIFYRVDLTVMSFMRDENTNMEEEVTNMYRQSTGVYCAECFELFFDELEAFISNSETIREIDNFNTCSGCNASINQFPYWVKLLFNFTICQQDPTGYKKIDELESLSIILCEDCLTRFMEYVNNFLNKKK